MYGVPADLPLEVFVNNIVDRIDLRPFIIHFNFSARNERRKIEYRKISAESKWELVSTTGEIIDTDSPGRNGTKVDGLKIGLLLNKHVTKYAIDPPRAFTLYFENGYGLVIYDDSEKYESFQIYDRPGDSNGIVI